MSGAWIVARFQISLFFSREILIFNSLIWFSGWLHQALVAQWIEY